MLMVSRHNVGVLGCSRGCLWGASLVRDGGAHGCSWWAGVMLGSWGVPGGARGVLIQRELVHCLAKGGMQVLMDAHGALVGARLVCDGTSFG